MATEREQTRLFRKMRVRKKVTGTPARPRLSVFRSSKHMYAQLIDDTTGATLVAASTLDAAAKSDKPIEQAKKVGALIAERAKSKQLSKIVFDRNGFLYHGRVKAVAEGARENGLEF